MTQHFLSWQALRRTFFQISCCYTSAFSVQLKHWIVSDNPTVSSNVRQTPLRWNWRQILNLGALSNQVHREWRCYRLRLVVDLVVAMTWQHCSVIVFGLAWPATRHSHYLRYSLPICSSGQNVLFCRIFGKSGLLRDTPFRSAKDRNYRISGPVDDSVPDLGLFETPVVGGRLHVLCHYLVLPPSRCLTTIVLFCFDSQNPLQARI